MSVLPGGARPCLTLRSGWPPLARSAEVFDIHPGRCFRYVIDYSGHGHELGPQPGQGGEPVQGSDREVSPVSQATPFAPLAAHPVEVHDRPLVGATADRASGAVHLDVEGEPAALDGLEPAADYELLTLPHRRFVAHADMGADGRLVVIEVFPGRHEARALDDRDHRRGGQDDPRQMGGSHLLGDGVMGLVGQSDGQ